MYREKIEEILGQYVKRFDELNEQGKGKADAGYKWRVLDEAGKFDLDAADLHAEFEKLTESTQKLLETNRVQPSGGIVFLLEHDGEEEFVRNSFRTLLETDDDGDLQDRQKRIEAFITDINRHLGYYLEKPDSYRQTMNSAVGYLFFHNPRNNYFYKPTTAENWAMSIEYNEDFGHGKTFSLESFYRMCEELKDALKDYPEVLELNERRMKEMNIQTDDGLHMLVYDIMACTDQYNLDENRIKMSVKDRLARVAIREERERLMDRLLKIDNRLEEIGDVRMLPDLTGETVQHKKYGSGRVTSCGDGRIEVDFGKLARKFQYPDAFAKGYLSTENEADQKKFQENADIMTERHELLIEKARVEESLKHIG